jgi:hypothetical protein
MNIGDQLDLKIQQIELLVDYYEESSTPENLKEKLKEKINKVRQEALNISRNQSMGKDRDARWQVLMPRIEALNTHKIQQTISFYFSSPSWTTAESILIEGAKTSDVKSLLDNPKLGPIRLKALEEGLKKATDGNKEILRECIKKRKDEMALAYIHLREDEEKLGTEISSEAPKKGKAISEREGLRTAMELGIDAFSEYLEKNGPSTMFISSLQSAYQEAVRGGKQEIAGILDGTIKSLEPCSSQAAAKRYEFSEVEENVIRLGGGDLDSYSEFSSSNDMSRVSLEAYQLAKAAAQKKGNNFLVQILEGAIKEIEKQRSLEERKPSPASITTPRVLKSAMLDQNPISASREGVEEHVRGLKRFESPVAGSLEGAEESKGEGISRELILAASGPLSGFRVFLNNNSRMLQGKVSLKTVALAAESIKSQSISNLEKNEMLRLLSDSTRPKTASQPLENRYIDLVEKGTLEQLEVFFVENQINSDSLETFSIEALQEARRRAGLRSDSLNFMLISDVLLELKEERINPRIAVERLDLNKKVWEGIDKELVNSVQQKASFKMFLEKEKLPELLKRGAMDLKVSLEALKKARNILIMNKRFSVLQRHYEEGNEFRLMYVTLDEYIKEIEAREGLPYSLRSPDTQVNKKVIQQQEFSDRASAKEILCSGLSEAGWNQLAKEKKIEHIIKNGTYTGKVVQNAVLRNRIQCVDTIVNLMKRTSPFKEDIELQERLGKDTKEDKAYLLAVYFECLRKRGYPLEGSYINLMGVNSLPVRQTADIRTVAESYRHNPIVVSKTIELAEGAVFDRQTEKPICLNIAEEAEIRGDGACYYRTIYVGALQNYILSESRQLLFTNLANRFKEVTEKIPEGKERVDHLSLINLLERAARGEQWNTIQEFERDILCDLRIDLSIIRATKYLTAKWIDENKDTRNGNDLTIREIISITRSDTSNIEDYCRKYVLEMDRDAEDTFVDKGVVLGFFDVPGGIVNVENRASVPSAYVASPHQPLNYPGHSEIRIIARRQGPHFNLFYDLSFVNRRDASALLLDENS